MTQKRIFELARRHALEIWTKAEDYLRESPEDPVARSFEEKAFKELCEIDDMIRKLDGGAQC